ncbi:hypothetical protein OKA05_10375 [Luteolibacter arcticus]|uniref:Uncharacterized protein n=1 Tax=Luteolibacter arcticus TaxID=1581411 RepID=A0ABT3GH86_9BACT|nr:hypothetical protein [Luteolibacter arcticus]MCW1922957.1 hypothetical protein [Luteolibacter arcticus]
MPPLRADNSLIERFGPTASILAATHASRWNGFVPPDDVLNPYAPPAEETAAAETPGVWRVEGDCLIVREGTVLPRVDLDGRGKGGPLTPMWLKLPVPLDVKGIAVTSFIALPVLGYIIFQSMRGGRLSVVWAMVIAMVAQFLLRGVKVRTGPANVFGYISVPAVRAMTRRARWRRWLTGALLVPVVVIFPLMAAYPLMTKRYDQVIEVAKLAGGMVAVSLVILLGVAVWGEFDKGWRCPRFRDGWLWVKGIGPQALIELGARSVGYQPVPVKRKVLKMRLDRMPLAFWRKAHGSGPLGRLWTWWFRWQTKGKPLEHDIFHWSERDWLAPEEADPELLAAWRSEIAGTPLADWTMAYSERVASPVGCDQVTELVFLSPDGRHTAIPSITRIVIGRKLRETRDLNFRSFTTGGRIIATATSEPVGPLPEEVKFALAKGSPMEVAAAHLQRISGEDLVPMNAEEARRQEEREMQLNHEAMEAAGIYGPIEEMDFFRP